MMNDTDRASARCAVRPVMGQKRLKAIAVRGTRGVKVWDGPHLLAEMSRKPMDHYYSLRGWTPDGVPSGEKLLSLGLDEAGGTSHPADRR